MSLVFCIVSLVYHENFHFWNYQDNPPEMGSTLTQFSMEILDAFPDLELADIREALHYAAEAVRERELPFIDAV